jgi:hypothetical protein
MESLTIISLVLGIVASIITIISFFLPKNHIDDSTRLKPKIREVNAATIRTPKTKATTSKSELAKLGTFLESAAAIFWAVVGVGCILEGLTYGNLFLIVLGGMFIYFARYLWRSRAA